MRTAVTSRKYRKDIKRCAARGMDMEKLRIVFDALRKDQKLPASCRPHKLTGNFKDYRECHIAPDWLLIYDISDSEYLYLERTGTHSDLFR